MTNLTLESLRAEHQRLGDMIERFSLQIEPATTQIHFPELLLELNHGEHYAGIVLGKDGEPSYHLILLPGQATDITWDKAMEWASKQGGEYVASLPTSRELSLLYANLKEEFDERAYWSCEAHESESGWAWSQTFPYGGQGSGPKGDELRARAVRRLIAEITGG